MKCIFLAATIVYLAISSSGFGAPRDRIPAIQSSFQASIDNGVRRYDYLWRDSNGSIHETTFEFRETDISQGCADIKRPDLTGDTVAGELSRLVSDMAELRGYSAQLVESGGNMSVHLEGRGVTPEEVKRFTERVESARETLHTNKLRSGFYSVTEKDGKSYIFPDYTALIDRYRKFGEAMAASLDETAPADPRGKAQHVLDFIQSVPYSQVAPNGTGFQTPAGMLEENSGDCDTKSVALAAVLKGMGIDCVLAAIPGHMFAGVEVERTAEDKSFVCGERVFVGCEPSGKAYLLGEISPETEKSVKDGEVETFAGSDF